MATPLDSPDEKPTLLERLSAFLTREPEDREELIALLDRSPGWRRIYADKVGVIYVRE